MTKSLENKFSEAVQSIEPSHEFSENLWNEIKATPQRSSKSWKISPWGWVPAAAVGALVVVLFVVSPQQVLASLRGLFDYLPGIGIVQDDESTLYLAEPIILEEDGARLILEQVVADVNKTVVAYHLEDINEADSEDARLCFYSENHLLLPDGKRLLPTSGGVSGNEARIEYFPLPADVSQLTLIAGQNSEQPGCIGPQEWKVDFSLGTTKPEDMDFLPVVDHPTATPAESPAAAADDEIQLLVNKTVFLEDGYLIYGHAEFSNEHWMNVNVNWETMTALDAEGKAIPLEQTDEIINNDEFVIKISTLEFVPPLTIHVDSLWISGFYPNPSFSFDAGADPQIGQTWDIHQDVELDEANISVRTARAILEPDDLAKEEPQSGYGFEIHNNTGVHFNGFIVCEGEGDSLENWGQTMPVDESTMIFETYYENGLPAGLVSCSFVNTHVLMPGAWEIEWQPPQSTQADEK